MNSKKSYVKSILIISTIISLSISCSKDNIDISLGNTQTQDTSTTSSKDSTNSNSSDTTNTELTKMNFEANVYSMYTRASSMSEIEAGRYVTVYPYNTTNSQLASKSESYISSVGTLSPSVTGSSGLSLVTGTYNLFAVGVNSPAGTAVPTFSGSSVTGLKNQIDYIWWTKSSLVVSGISQNITMNLQHCCTQVVVVFLNATGVTFSSVPTMSLSASTTTSNTWNLFTGVISNSTSVDSTTMVSMPVSKGASTTATTDSVYYGQCTMMPLSMTGNMLAQFTVSINSNTANYKVNLPVYQNNLQAGYTYVYKVKFTSNGITFDDTVNVVNWVAVDANQTPLIPTQI